MKGNELRIVLVSPLPPPTSGIGTWTDTILTSCRNLPNINVIHLDTAVRWRRPDDLRPFVRIPGGVLHALWLLLRLGVLLLRFRPNLVHICTSAGPALWKDVVMLRMSKLAGARTALHLHTSRVPLDEQNASMAWEATKMAVRAADTVIVLDRETEKCLTRSFPTRAICRLPNPIRLDAVRSFSTLLGERQNKESVSGNPGMEIVFVGHVSEPKGVSQLVSAVATNPGISLNLVGPVMQDYRSELESLAQTHGDGGWLRFCGELPRQQVLKEIARADVLALPSLRRYEAFPYAVLEGMACGKPILATSVGAVPDMIGAGGQDAAGICVEPGDVSQLADAVRQLRDNNDLRIQMGKNGESRVHSHFEAEKVSKQLSDLWLSMCDIRDEIQLDTILIRR